MSRRVITISRKKWGKSAAKTERIVRDAVLKSDTTSNVDEYLKKAKSITCFDLANRFNIRISVARQILREKEAEGIVIPYIREGGFVVYTTPVELEKREGGAPIMVADALEEVASSVPKETVITEEMDIALLAAGTPGAVKPGRLAWKRREVGEKKERKDTRPEVVVEPLVAPAAQPEVPIVEKPEKKEAPKKKAPAKKKEEKKEAPKKKAPTKKKEAPKKKAPAKKKEEKKAAPKKKAPTKKKEEKEKTPKKTTSKKKAEEKPAKKTTTKKKADEKKSAKKTTKKKK